MKIKDLIKKTRLSLCETQDVFAKRFNVNPSTVSLWETGSREAGYEVIEFCINQKDDKKQLKVNKMFLETSERFSGFSQLVIVDENNEEWTVRGDYCGGIPVVSFHKIEAQKEDSDQLCDCGNIKMDESDFCKDCI